MRTKPDKYDRSLQIGSTTVLAINSAPGQIESLPKQLRFAHELERQTMARTGLKRNTVAKLTSTQDFPLFPDDFAAPDHLQIPACACPSIDFLRRS